MHGENPLFYYWQYLKGTSKNRVCNTTAVSSKIDKTPFNESLDLVNPQ